MMMRQHEERLRWRDREGKQAGRQRIGTERGKRKSPVKRTQRAPVARRQREKECARGGRGEHGYHLMMSKSSRVRLMVLCICMATCGLTTYDDVIKQRMM